MRVFIFIIIFAKAGLFASDIPKSVTRKAACIVQFKNVKEPYHFVLENKGEESGSFYFDVDFQSGEIYLEKVKDAKVFYLNTDLNFTLRLDQKGICTIVPMDLENHMDSLNYLPLFSINSNKLIRKLISIRDAEGEELSGRPIEITRWDSKEVCLVSSFSDESNIITIEVTDHQRTIMEFSYQQGQEILTYFKYDGFEGRSTREDSFEVRSKHLREAIPEVVKLRKKEINGKSVSLIDLGDRFELSHKYSRNLSSENLKIKDRSILRFVSGKDVNELSSKSIIDHLKKDTGPIVLRFDGGKISEIHSVQLVDLSDPNLAPTQPK